MAQQTQKFNAKLGAALLVALGLLYMVLALVTGHSAVAEFPPDLSAYTAGLDVWHTLALMVRQGNQLVIVDVRKTESYDQYHLSGSIHIPDASVAQLADISGSKPHVLLVAEDDQTASSLVGEVTQLDASSSYHFLNGGVQSWYLALELPVPLFNEQPPPYGYTAAMAIVTRWLAEPESAESDNVLSAIEKLVTLGYQPTQLAADKKPLSSGGRKKIAGGCG